MSQLKVHQEIMTESEREKKKLLEKVLKLEQMVSYFCFSQVKNSRGQS